MIWGKAVGLLGFMPSRPRDEVDRFFDLEYRRESADYRDVLNREFRKGLKNSSETAK